MKLVAFRVLLFKSASCHFCEEMDKKKTIEKFTAKHYPPKMPVQTLVCINDDGEAPEGSELEKNFRISDGYGVEGFPTVIIEGRKKDGTAFEVARMDSSTVSDYSARELDRVFKEGMKAVNDLPDDTLSQDEAAKQIPW